MSIIKIQSMFEWSLKYHNVLTGLYWIVVMKIGAGTNGQKCWNLFYIKQGVSTYLSYRPNATPTLTPQYSNQCLLTNFFQDFVIKNFFSRFFYGNFYQKLVQFYFFHSSQRDDKKKENIPTENVLNFQSKKRSGFLSW